MPGLRADVPVSCVIDAHVHMPALKAPADVNRYVRGLVEAGVGGAVIIGIPPFKEVVAGISIDDVRAEHERVRHLIERYAAEVAEQLEPEALYLNTVRLAESFCTFARHSQVAAMDSFAAVFPVNMLLGRDELAAQLEEAASRGFRGFKIISTLFMQPLNSEAVDVALEVAEERGLPVVVHGGCDPGIWELPRYCKYGDPSKLEGPLRSHRDATVIVAHAGGYSAIAPGVFFEETLQLARRFPNVLVDTSALPPSLAAMVVRDFPEGRVMYGSDYPAVSNAGLREYMEEVFLRVASLGLGRERLERYAHGLASEVFKVSCLPEHYSYL